MLDCEARVHIGRTVRSRPSAALPQRPGAVRARRAAHFPTVAGMPAEADVLLDQTFHALADVSRGWVLVRRSRWPPLGERARRAGCDEPPGRRSAPRRAAGAASSACSGMGG